jgi:hypothetical protein
MLFRWKRKNKQPNWSPRERLREHLEGGRISIIHVLNSWFTTPSVFSCLIKNGGTLASLTEASPSLLALRNLGKHSVSRAPDLGDAGVTSCSGRAIGWGREALRKFSGP